MAHAVFAVAPATLLARTQPVVTELPTGAKCGPKSVKFVNVGPQTYVTSCSQKSSIKKSVLFSDHLMDGNLYKKIGFTEKGLIQEIAFEAMT